MGSNLISMRVMRLAEKVETGRKGPLSKEVRMLSSLPGRQMKLGCVPVPASRGLEWGWFVCLDSRQGRGGPRTWTCSGSDPALSSRVVGSPNSTPCTPKTVATASIGARTLWPLYSPAH